MGMYGNRFGIHASCHCPIKRLFDCHWCICNICSIADCNSSVGRAEKGQRAYTEVSAYVYRENVILTFIGVLAGAVFGIFLHRYIIRTVEVDAVMFGRNINPVSFLYCGLLTIGFSMIVNLFMHQKLKKIDMVESLKSVE